MGPTHKPDCRWQFPESASFSCENDMSTGARTEPGHLGAVTALGVITLLLGVAYAAFGGWAIVDGASWFALPPSQEPMTQVVALGGIVPAFIIVFGAVFLLLGILVLLAGVGLLWRKQWGRVLTFILAVVAILLGLAWALGGDQGARDVALGATQILYGILALVILIQKGAEFSRPQV
jgi:hypothetical protein